MTFTRVLLAWGLVTLCFSLWRELERRVRGTPAEAGDTLRASLTTNAIEAALLTLFAGLWFASLGSGGAVLLFLLVGALMEIPSRLRNQPFQQLAWKPVIGGIIRIVIAGVVLGAVMG